MCSKYMGLFLAREELLKLYAQADKNNSNYIDRDEFKDAVIMLKKRIATRALERAGMAPEDLVWVLILGITVLLVL